MRLTPLKKLDILSEEQKGLEIELALIYTVFAEKNINTISTEKIQFS